MVVLAESVEILATDAVECLGKRLLLIGDLDRDGLTVACDTIEGTYIQDQHRT